MMGEVFQSLLTLEVILVLVLAPLAGIVIGALPGLTTTMAVALLLPMTFGMQPIVAIVMLVAVYGAATYGGAIPAILLHTPGAPSSAATAMDGYALTQKGQGLKALGVATISSVFGGLVGAFVLLTLAPPLARLSLNFSAAEYFLMALFGLTIIGSLSNESMIKGLTAGAFGLMVAVIGLSNNGFVRYTFGNMHLMGGIPMVPALIGLFSLSQVLIQVENKEAADADMKKIEAIKGSFFPTKEEFRYLTPTILRATIVGIFIGILPGAGGDVGSWVAYNEAKRKSKNKEMFGKGSLEGVAAPETANNAVASCSLIPTLTFGIPGSSVAAVILGGLTIQGLVPGWQLFTVHGHITYAIIIGFIFCNIIKGFFGFLAARHIVKVTRVPIALMMPIIVVLAVVGSFSMMNTMYPVYVMVVFGGLGYLMRKLGFPPAPTVLALILGPIAERSLSQAIMMSRVPMLQYFFTRPISVVFIVLILLTLFKPMFSHYMSKRMNAVYGENTNK